MDFYAVLDQVLELLRRRGRVSYRALTLQFHLDAEHLEALAAAAYDLLEAVAPLDAVTLQGALAQLVEAELVTQRGIPPQATYTFKPALIQDAAYQSLLRSTRQQYHERIAHASAVHFPETVETQPELLAHHYTEAGLHEPAVVYWQRAGERAIQRSAYQEAISHFTQGLEALQTLPATPERARCELTLHIALGMPLQATRGYTAPEVGRAYARARELSQQVGDTPQVFSALWGLWRFYLAGGEARTAHELAEQCLSLAQRAQDASLLLEAHQMLGISLYQLGEIVPAHTHFERGVALYTRQQHHAQAFLYGDDPGVSCMPATPFPEHARRLTDVWTLWLRQMRRCLWRCK